MNEIRVKLWEILNKKKQLVILNNNLNCFIY